ncbi:MAG: hypothetical protein P9M08_02525 [Candidatus Erginobacter occultus]|nr:hypothetical protein [Candidatus Erginobacter occultus]
MSSKKTERWIRFGDKVLLEKAFIPANACVVKERPKGHKRYYHYLYFRMEGRLRKRYIPADEVDFTKKIISELRDRSKRNRENVREAEKLCRKILRLEKLQQPARASHSSVGK